MIEKSCGSTWSWEKIARIVTGSVADRIEPKIMLSKKLMLMPSKWRRANKKVNTLEDHHPSVHKL
jgi:hypothetical protein